MKWIRANTDKSQFINKVVNNVKTHKIKCQSCGKEITTVACFDKDVCYPCFKKGARVK